MAKSKAKPATPITGPKKRPVCLSSTTTRVRTAHGNLFVTVTFEDGERPFEVFSILGKGGGCNAALLEGLSRMISLALRSGVDEKEVVEQLIGITCCPHADEQIQSKSPVDAVAQVLRDSGGKEVVHDKEQS